MRVPTSSEGDARPRTATFAEWLRERSDEQLRALVSARPELITPVPAHLDGLAARAASPASLGRALDRLDRFALAVVETLAVLGEPMSRARLTELLGAEPPVERLQSLALLYGPDQALTLAPGVTAVLDHPAGLGPSVSESFRDHPPARLAELADEIAPGTEGSAEERLASALADPAKLIESVSPEAREALNQLAWGPPTGRVPNARREVTVATAHSPIEQLLARGLLAATGPESVTLPREVALHLREGHLHRELSATPPSVDGAARDHALVDRTAAAQAFELVRSVEELSERWSVEPPSVLRTGGLGIRDLKRAAALLDRTEWESALIIEIANAAGLIAAADGEWLPTPRYDQWRAEETAERWARLAAAWLRTDRTPGLIGGRDDRDRPYNALHPDLHRPAAPALRRATLAILQEGLAPSPAAVRERLAWEQPRRRGPLRDQLVEFGLREAEQVGVTGLGALSRHGGALLTGAETAAGLLAPLLPEPIDHILLQADLTAVAPGPLTGDLNRWLALAADVESKGGATVYRFSETSVRRALDAGQSADDLLAMLARHSATPVPQPLSYLVADVARRHGQIRIGTAGAYLRCDDPALLDQVMADRRAAPLQLRRLAATVIASRATRGALVDSLRAMGYAPVAESLDGDVLITQLDSRRAEGATRVPAVLQEGPEPEVVTAAVRAMRAGDERRSPVDAPEGQAPRGPSAATVTALREAIRQGVRVWIGYLDSQGHATSRILEPARVEGGYLTAYDETRAAVHRFALHRVTGVSDLSQTD